MIPDGWKSGKINELNHYITSGSRGWAQYYSDSGDLFVRITNLTRERLSLDLSDSKYVGIPENSNEGKRTRLMVGDILISITADLGIIGFVKNEFDKPAYINQHVALLRIDEKEIDNRFIAYQMASESGHQQFISLNDAGAKSGLNLDSIRRFSILIPPLLEQCRIAEVLGVWDELIDLLERLIGKTRSRKQGLMQQLLTGKKRFKEFEGSEWKISRIGSFVKVQGGFAFKSENFSDSGIHVIRISNIQSCAVDLTSTLFHQFDPKLAQYQINHGDILIAMSGATTGKVGRYQEHHKSYLNQRVGRFTALDKTKVSMDFVFQIVRSNKFQHLIMIDAIGGAQPNISSLDIENIVLKFPSLPEQEKIAAVLSAADEEISTLEKQLAAYKQQKLGLMQQLLTGRIRI